jgi:hypothetical protein
VGQGVAGMGSKAVSGLGSMYYITNVPLSSMSN